MTNGPLLMVLANLMFGLTPLTVRLSGRAGVPSDQITFIRFLFGSIGVLGLAWLGWSGRLESRNWRVLILRGIYGGVSVLCFFYAIEKTGSGKGTLLNYTHSIWANVYAVVLFRQSPPRGFWFLLFMAATGLWLVIDPDLSARPGETWGVAAGVLSGMMGGAAVVTVRSLRRTDNALSIFASFSFIGIFFSFIPAAAGALRGESPFGHWVLPGARGWYYLALMALFSMAAQLVFTHAYAYTSLALGTIMALSVPAIASLVGHLLLKEPLTPHFLLGGTLIMGACAALGLQEGLARLRAKPSGAPPPSPPVEPAEV